MVFSCLANPRGVFLALGCKAIATSRGGCAGDNGNGCLRNINLTRSGMLFVYGAVNGARYAKLLQTAERSPLMSDLVLACITLTTQDRAVLIPTIPRRMARYGTRMDGTRRRMSSFSINRKWSLFSYGVTGELKIILFVEWGWLLLCRIWRNRREHRGGCKECPGIHHDLLRDLHAVRWTTPTSRWRIIWCTYFRVILLLVELITSPV